MSDVAQPAGKIQMLLGVFILCVLIAGVSLTAWLGYRFLASIDSDISVAAIAAAATVLVSVLSIVLGKIYESRQVVEREIRENKIPIYEEFLSFMSRLLHGEKVGKKPTDEEMLAFFIEFNQKMMVWGSDSVLSAWGEWRKTIAPMSGDDADPRNLAKMMHGYENIIYAIRRDLGHKNNGLAKGDLLRLFINDYDDFIG